MREEQQSKRIWKIAILIPLLASLTGCETTQTGGQSSKMAKQTKVSVFFQTDDLLYTQVLGGQEAVGPILKRIEKYLTKDLADRGITAEPQNEFNQGDAKVTIAVTTIETVTKSDIGLWSPVVKQQPRVKYSATLLSPEGNKLLCFDDSQDDESIDNLAKKVAEKAGSRITRYYR